MECRLINSYRFILELLIGLWPIVDLCYNNLLSAEINGAVPNQNAAMSADNEVDEATKQVSGLSLQGNSYNPDTVPYEVATFALS